MRRNQIILFVLFLSLINYVGYLESFAGAASSSEHQISSDHLTTEVKARFENVFPPPLEGDSSSTIVRNGQRLPVRPEQLSESPFTFTIPEVSQTTFPNGMKVFSLITTASLGVHVTVLVEAGTVYDPPDKVGLAELTAQALRTGGAGKYTADDFDRELDKLGAEFAVDVQRDYARFDLFCLSQNWEQALRLLSQAFIAPHFEDAAVEREKILFRERIVRQEDEPAELSRREFRKVIYGTTHPLARSPRPDDILQWKKRDVIAFYETHYLPSVTRIGLAGPPTIGSPVPVLKTSFAEWHQNAPGFRRSVPFPTADGKPAYKGVFLLEKDMGQAFFRLGHLGKKRDFRDQPVVDVLNNILGMGGLTSRLMQKIRTEHGLAYGVGGGVFEDDPVGIFAVVGSTKSASLAQAISLAVEVTSETRLLSPEKEELETAKKDAIYAFANRFSSPKDVVVQYMIADLYGYPKEYLRRYCDVVRSVRGEDVLHAAQRYLRPEELTIFVLGPASVKDQLQTAFGQSVLPWNAASQKAAVGEKASSSGTRKRR